MPYPTPPDAHPAWDGARKPPLRLLLVGDPIVGEEGLSHQLRRCGFAILTSDGGPEALRQVAARAVDLVVVDVSGSDPQTSKWHRRLLERAAQAGLPLFTIALPRAADSEPAASPPNAAALLRTTTDVERVASELRSLAIPTANRPTSSACATADSPTYAADELPKYNRSGLPAASDPQSFTSAISHLSQLEPQLQSGAVLDGRYRVGALIDRGGFGSVYQGLDLVSQLPVAIKVLHPHLVASAKIVRRFQLEAISTCRVRHPNAVAILDSGTTTAAIPYLVMEYLEGVTLETELRQHPILPFTRCATILHQLCAVLTHAHTLGLIHRGL